MRSSKIIGSLKTRTSKTETNKWRSSKKWTCKVTTCGLADLKNFATDFLRKRFFADRDKSAKIRTRKQLSAMWYTLSLLWNILVLKCCVVK